MIGRRPDRAWLLPAGHAGHASASPRRCRSRPRPGARPAEGGSRPPPAARHRHLRAGDPRGARVCFTVIAADAATRRRPRGRRLINALRPLVTERRRAPGGLRRQPVEPRPARARAGNAVLPTTRRKSRWRWPGRRTGVRRQQRLKRGGEGPRRSAARAGSSLSDHHFGVARRAAGRPLERPQVAPGEPRQVRRPHQRGVDGDRSTRSRSAATPGGSGGSQARGSARHRLFVVVALRRRDRCRAPARGAEQRADGTTGPRLHRAAHVSTPKVAGAASPRTPRSARQLAPKARPLHPRHPAAGPGAARLEHQVHRRVRQVLDVRSAASAQRTDHSGPRTATAPAPAAARRCSMSPRRRRVEQPARRPGHAPSGVLRRHRRSPRGCRVSSDAAGAAGYRWAHDDRRHLPDPPPPARPRRRADGVKLARYRIDKVFAGGLVGESRSTCWPPPTGRGFGGLRRPRARPGHPRRPGGGFVLQHSGSMRAARRRSPSPSCRARTGDLVGLPAPSTSPSATGSTPTASTTRCSGTASPTGSHAQLRWRGRAAGGGRAPDEGARTIGARAPSRSPAASSLASTRWMPRGALGGEAAAAAPAPAPRASRRTSSGTTRQASARRAPPAGSSSPPSARRSRPASPAASRRRRRWPGAATAGRRPPPATSLKRL